VKKIAMGGACSMHRRDEKCKQKFWFGKSERKRLLERPGRKREDNIRRDLREIE
jgi:hypothetical protein